MLTKYRPKTLSDVVGHEAVVSSLRDRSARAYLFIGPSGVGKTTLARIVADRSGAYASDTVEIDGATFNGVDDMRTILTSVPTYGMMGEGKKAYIVDECHQLSKAAWQSLLKAVEDPPEHVTWIFCTTEGSKVPETIKTRCAVYELRPLPVTRMVELLARVLESEDMVLAEGVADLLISESGGSPRRMLSALMVAGHASSVKEARELLTRDTPAVEAVDLARCIFSGDRFTMASVRPILAALKDTSPEGVRIVVMAYAHSVFLKAPDPMFACKVMGAFEAPVLETSKMAAISVRVARLIYGR